MRDIESLKVEVVQYLSKKQVIGSHNKQIDTVANWFASHEQGRVKDAIDELVSDPDAPVQKYGGQRNAIQLTSAEGARKYLQEHGEDIPWRLRD